MLPASPSEHMLYPSLNDLSALIEQARRWLRTSGVVRPEGAVLAWLAPENPHLQFISAEITGYALSYFCWAGQLEQAQRSGRWLAEQAQDPGGALRCRWYAEGAGAWTTSHSGPLRWCFDTGIVLKALVDLYLLSGDATLRQPIEAAVAWLLEVRGPDGLFPGRWDVARSAPCQDLQRWSAQTGAYQIKIERGIVAAAQALGRPSWLAGVEQRVDLAIRRFQAGDGRFVSYPHTGGVHAHPHLYACESLWALGTLLDLPRWREAARRGTRWIAGLARVGSPPRTCFDGQLNYHGRCDAAAQYLRCLICMELPQPLILAAAARLASYARADGGFVFGWNSDGSANQHADAWGTMAAIQALTWLSGAETADPRRLI